MSATLSAPSPFHSSLAKECHPMPKELYKGTCCSGVTNHGRLVEGKFDEQKRTFSVELTDKYILDTPFLYLRIQCWSPKNKFYRVSTNWTNALVNKDARVHAEEFKLDA